VLLSAIFIHLYFAFIRQSGTAAETVTVKCDNTEYTYSVFENTEKVIKSNGYTLTLIIKNGSVWVENATCPDKCCENVGKISKSGESIVCLPAKCSISVSGKGDADAKAG